MSIRTGKIIIVLTVCLAAGIVSACGKKGPLYLPDQQQQQAR